MDGTRSGSFYRYADFMFDAAANVYQNPDTLWISGRSVRNGSQRTPRLSVGRHDTRELWLFVGDVGHSEWRRPQPLGSIWPARRIHFLR